MRRRVTITAALVAAVLIVVGALLLLDRGGGGSSEPTGATLEESWRRLMLRGVRQEKTRQFGPGNSIAETVGIEMNMPSKMRRAARKGLRKAGPLMNLRFDEARYLKTPLGIGLWLVSGRGVTCIFHAVTAALSCSTTLAVNEKGILLEVYMLGAAPRKRPMHFVALGIAPDWAKAVRATVGHEAVTIPVVDNAYGYRAEVPIKVRRLIRTSRAR